MIAPAAFALAYGLDLLIGDPLWLPHPVRWMGQMIQAGEKVLWTFARTPLSEFLAGLVLTVAVIGTFGLGSRSLLHWLRGGPQILAFAVSTYLLRLTNDETCGRARK